MKLIIASAYSALVIWMSYSETGGLVLDNTPLWLLLLAIVVMAAVMLFLLGLWPFQHRHIYHGDDNEPPDIRRAADEWKRGGGHE
jgi:hypothetical protein